ncbi:hypothetical protein RCO48_33160 [Peribacillus frigoritolerans]|nr:hypothetical protein [Peribacillus frigoritolerans]
MQIGTSIKRKIFPVNPEFREKMILKEKELEIEIQKMIDEFNRVNEKGVISGG